MFLEASMIIQGRSKLKHKKTPHYAAFIVNMFINYSALKRASSVSCASAKARIPSASFSVAIAS